MVDFKGALRRLRKRILPPSVDAFDGRMDALDARIGLLEAATTALNAQIERLMDGTDWDADRAGRVRASEISSLLRKVDIDNHPNINALWQATKDIDAIELNIKNFGYQLARELQSQLPEPSTNTEALPHVVSSRPCRQSDIEAPWFAHWCAALKIPVIYHRKIWEYGFLLQTLHDVGLLRSGVRGLGFGCGEEPMPSFFANLGIGVVMTDLPPELVKGTGWAETAQHASSQDIAWHSNLVERSVFDERVSLRYVDMNAIPQDLRDFDFCWSICAFEHLGSIRKGLDFIHNSLKTLQIGGWSIHTTEFNYMSRDETIDGWPTVLFLRKHFEQLATELTANGHIVAPLDFDVGSGVLDRFIDVPPYAYGEGWLVEEQWRQIGQAAHLKLSVDGHASTCFGLAVQRGR